MQSRRLPDIHCPLLPAVTVTLILGSHPLQYIPIWKDSLAQDTGLSVHFREEGRLPGPLGHLERQAAYSKKSVLYPSPSLKSSFNNLLST